MVALFKELGRPFPPILVVFSYPILPTFVNSRKKAIINTINYMEKELYYAPDTEVIELKVGSALLDASLLNNGGNAFGERYDTDTI